jgi:acyl-CoA synthetase (AMP-forming)/AMP-acid ligase II
MSTPTRQIGYPLLHDYLAESARRLPDKVALVCKGKRHTYAELDAKANALANALVKRGVARGDRVVVFGDNVVETVIAFWGVLKANAVVSIVNPLTKADKLAYLLNDCRATALVTDAHLTPVFAEGARKSPHLKAILISNGVDAKRTDGLPGVEALRPRSPPSEATRRRAASRSTSTSQRSSTRRGAPASRRA